MMDRLRETGYEGGFYVGSGARFWRVNWAIERGILLFFCLLCLVFLPVSSASGADGQHQAKLAKGAKADKAQGTVKGYSPAELTQLSRLRGRGFGDQPQLYLRLFKASKELEVWVLVGSTYKLYRSFPICAYSGELGPKLKEGDGQAPEGFYHVPVEMLIWRSKRWPQALSLGFPNVFDAQNGRTGSYLLIHGGCSSKGCYALENGPMSALFALVGLAARGGQTMFPIHIFPFRFTKANWARFKTHRWAPFWRDLAPAFHHFNQARLLPRITVCPSGYAVSSLHRLQTVGRRVVGGCTAPLPLFALERAGERSGRLDWVAALLQRYEKMKAQHARRPAEPKFVVRCNLKRPSCVKWVALKKKRLARGLKN